MLTIFPVLGKLAHMQSVAVTRLDKGKRNVNEIDCKHQGTKAFPNRLCRQSKSLQTIATGSKRAYVQKCKSIRAQKYKSTKVQKHKRAIVQECKMCTCGLANSGGGVCFLGAERKFVRGRKRSHLRCTPLRY